MLTNEEIARRLEGVKASAEMFDTKVLLSVEDINHVITALRNTPPSFQERVAPWMHQCFGPEISADVEERQDRLLEEVLELIQVGGYTADRAHALVDYTFGRPIGKRAQEVGGVMVTLAALCLATVVDMHECGERELRRIWGKIDEIRAKQAAKPKHSPLPIVDSHSIISQQVESRCLAQQRYENKNFSATIELRENGLSLYEVRQDGEVKAYGRIHGPKTLIDAATRVKEILTDHDAWDERKGWVVC